MVRGQQTSGKRCGYCRRTLGSGAQKHLEACRKQELLKRRLRDRQRARMLNKVDHRKERAPSIPIPPVFYPDPIASLPEPEFHGLADNSPPPLRSSPSPVPMNVEHGRSRIHIEIEHHPHSGKPPEFISLDTTRTGESTSARLRRQLVPATRPPWAPFPSRADFEWAESVYMMPAGIIKAQLKGLHSNWCRDTNITIKTVEELRVYLERTKKYVVEFREHEFEETFDGEVYHFQFFYRDPWDWLLDLVSDPNLADDIIWYPSRKYLIVDGNRQRLRDEFCNSDKWWDMQSSLPVVDGLPHCIFPLLAWLDKGRVSSHTNMHPIILRSLALPSAIQNASGNGGGELVGFMVQVQDKKDPEDRPQAAKIRFAKFKRDVYHHVLKVLFVETLTQQATSGRCVPCGDTVSRVISPRVPVLSLDGEEACTCAATRSSLADFPCPRCLVRQDQLHDFFSKTVEFPLRTTATMKAIYEQARRERFKGAAEDLLQRYGLHSTENAFWSLEGSDPYDAISYDTLHSDDTGKWGKHLWPLLQNVLAAAGLKGMITTNMSKISRWPGLKHFDNVTTKDINDGQSWFDIEKGILPCVVQFLPKDSVLVHAIRAHTLMRMFMGLHCISEEQLERKDAYQEEYGKLCIKLSQKYDKSFDYPKQHALWHSTPDIRAKGPHSIYCTRVNEGFHQETREIYARLNKRNVDQQMTSLDAIREAMARIRMTVNQYDSKISDRIAALAIRADVKPVDIEQMPASPDDNHWQFGAPQNLVDSRYAMKKTPWIDDSTRKNFTSTLRAFIRDTFPEEPLREDGEELIQIRPFQCIYLHYTSLENWTDCCDVLRCNPSFQVNHEERFDAVVINMDDDPLTFGRLLFLFKCRLPSGRTEDITLVRLFKKSSWRPKTIWKNCRILEDSRTILALPRYFIRGAHMITCFGCTKADRTFFLDDVADLDWVLRAGN